VAFGKRPAARLAGVLFALLPVTLPSGGFAWYARGHRLVALAALSTLPPEVPEFVRRGGGTVGRLAMEPDVWKNRATPSLSDRVAPDHYLDFERLQDGRWPPLRSQFLAGIARRGLSTAQIGTLPYAVLEDTQRLTLAFAEARRFPGDEVAREQVLFWAGVLAHYAGDVDQPLHTTIDHDGRAKPDGSSPATGIHARVDALFEKARFDRSAAVAEIRPEGYADLPAAIRSEILASHALVDRVYRLEPQLMAEDGGVAQPDVVAFTRERFAATAKFIASLYLTAWRDSADVELPDWLEP
jgi:hypothetical protein